MDDIYPDSMINKAIREMSLPSYLDDEIVQLFNSINQESSYGMDFIRALVFLVAIRNKMAPDIDLIYNDGITSRIREFAENIKNVLAMSLDYDEPLVDDNIAIKIAEIYSWYYQALKNKFFDKYLRSEVRDIIVDHIEANTAQIAYLLHRFKPTYKTAISIIDDIYDDTFLISMEEIIYADIIILYDQMRFDVFSNFKLMQRFVDSISFESIPVFIFGDGLIRDYDDHFLKLSHQSYRYENHPYFHLCSTFEIFDVSHFPFNFIEELFDDIRDSIYRVFMSMSMKNNAFISYINENFADEIMTIISYNFNESDHSYVWDIFDCPDNSEKYIESIISIISRKKKIPIPHKNFGDTNFISYIESAIPA